MKAALHRSFGGLEVLDVTDVPDPAPAPGEVLVRVRVSALNRLDVLQRAGPALLPGFSLPHIAGMDVAGEVIGTTDGVVGLVVGDRVVVNPALHCGECELCRIGADAFCPDVRVVGGNSPGGYAELLAVPASHVYRIPEAFSYEEAASIPTTWSTAWHGLVVAGDLRVGEWVLIHAAASGVSTSLPSGWARASSRPRGRHASWSSRRSSVPTSS
jgi:NADPH:quinone reductase-like Zn-dependent oxidoreductase